MEKNDEKEKKRSKMNKTQRESKSKNDYKKRETFFSDRIHFRKRNRRLKKKRKTRVEEVKKKITHSIKKKMKIISNIKVNTKKQFLFFLKNFNFWNKW